MPDQLEPKTSAIVGEDGELLHGDATVDPDVYTQYVATHIRRDPVLFRMREHVQSWGCVYLFIFPSLTLFGVAIIGLGGSSDVKILALNIFGTLLFILVLLGGIYWATQRDTRA